MQLVFFSLYHCLFPSDLLDWADARWYHRWLYLRVHARLLSTTAVLTSLLPSNAPRRNSTQFPEAQPQCHFLSVHGNDVYTNWHRHQDIDRKNCCGGKSVCETEWKTLRDKENSAAVQNWRGTNLKREIFEGTVCILTRNRNESESESVTGRH